MQKTQKARFEKQSLDYHAKPVPGKIKIVSTKACESQTDLSMAYTPGVAVPCIKINKEPVTVWDYTSKGNTVAVVSDGTAVLGLGNIGPEAGMPVMEGKAVLFKRFADIDAIPLCIGKVFDKSGRTDAKKVIETVERLEPTFGGINLEDIGAPACFEVEQTLKKTMNIPVFHDDQHGTAVVVAAAFLNALKVVKKDIGSVKAVINGAGSAGIAISRHLLNLGLKDLTMVDRFGIICKGMEELNPAQAGMAEITNLRRQKGTLADAVKDADVFFGVSAPNVLTPGMVKTMSPGPIVFAMANPTPEIMPDLAREAGAAVVGTGRSDFPNQINNVLAFPGIFRGALDCRARIINEEMKAAASHALANLVTENDLSAEYILPDALDNRVAQAVAQGVMDAAYKTGVAKI